MPERMQISLTISIRDIDKTEWIIRKSPNQFEGRTKFLLIEDQRRGLIYDTSNIMDFLAFEGKPEAKCWLE